MDLQVASCCSSFCIPFLNILIRHLNQMQHLKFLLLLLFGYFLLGFSTVLMPVTFNYVWFGVLYILSSYIRLYPLKQDGYVKVRFVLTLISMLVGVASVLYLIKEKEILFLIITSVTQTS